MNGKNEIVYQIPKAQLLLSLINRNYTGKKIYESNATINRESNS